MGYRGQNIEEKHHKISNIYGYGYDDYGLNTV
jgi:cystathionine beta-lyase family protein involved in aluminum resistance